MLLIVILGICACVAMLALWLREDVHTAHNENSDEDN